MTAGDEHEEHVEHVDAVALALGEADGQARAAMAEHVLRCQACRQQYDDVAAVVSELLPVVPGVQPPIGFDERVLHRLGVTRRRRRRRWLVGAVAAAAVAVALLAGAWWLRDPTADGQADGDEVAALQLTDGGTSVGTVSVSEAGGRRVMVVAIFDAPADVSYRCRAMLADGRVVESEAWPAGAGAWLVPLPDDGDVTSVDVVVSGTDTVWSDATFANA